MSEFAARTVRGSLLMATLAVVGAACLGGWTAAVGVGTGSAVAVLVFVGLARAVALIGVARAPRLRWALVGLARWGVAFAALAMPMARGWAHPVGVATGLTVLPVALVVYGLRDARRLSLR